MAEQPDGSPLVNNNGPSTMHGPGENSIGGVDFGGIASPAVDVDETPATGEDPSAADAAEGPKSSYLDYLKSPTILIKVGAPPLDTILTAHLALLQTSPYLSQVCSTYANDTPLSDRVVELPGEDPSAVGAFLEFLYTGEYAPRLVAGTKPDELVLEEPASGSEVDEDGSQLLAHARIYTLAEKLEIPALKTLAHSKIHRINSTAKGELRYARYVYKNTSKDDKTIRHPIASFWAHRSHVLRHEAEHEFEGMVLEFPQFAYDILSIVLDQREKGKEKEKEKERERERPGRSLASGHEEPLRSPQTSVEKIPRSGRKRQRTSTVQ